MMNQVILVFSALTTFILKISSSVELSLYEVEDFKCSPSTKLGNSDCLTLSSTRAPISSINTYGSCILFWEQLGCRGEFLRVAPDIPHHNNIGLLKMKDGRSWSNEISSISSCDFAQQITTTLSPTPTTSKALANGPTVESTTNMNIVKQNVRRVTTSGEMHFALGNAVEGSVIELAEGVYSGQFVLRQNKVVIKGVGDVSIIQLEEGGTYNDWKVALDIFGNNCEVQNLKMVSNSKYTKGINITGSRNRFTNITVTHYTTGFYLSGNRNILSNIKLEDMRWGVAVQFVGNSNSVNSLNCDRCIGGIYIEGDDNSVEYVRMRNSVSLSHIWGIAIVRGNENLVNFFRGDGDRLVLKDLSSNAMVRNVVFGEAYVGGSGHTLLNVDAGELMEVYGSGHRISNSKAAMLNNYGTNVTITQSSFQPEK